MSDLSRNIENSAGTESLNDMVKDIRVMADELKILTK